MLNNYRKTFVHLHNLLTNKLLHYITYIMYISFETCLNIGLFTNCGNFHSHDIHKMGWWLNDFWAACKYLVVALVGRLWIIFCSTIDILIYPSNIHFLNLVCLPNPCAATLCLVGNICVNRGCRGECVPGIFIFFLLFLPQQNNSRFLS